jgi:hypothetical protein
VRSRAKSGVRRRVKMQHLEPGAKGSNATLDQGMYLVMPLLYLFSRSDIVTTNFLGSRIRLSAVDLLSRLLGVN